MGSLEFVLKAAVTAGVIAGAIMAGFHRLWLEPLIDRAIGLEEQASHPPATTPYRLADAAPRARARLRDLWRRVGTIV